MKNIFRYVLTAVIVIVVWWIAAVLINTPVLPLPLDTFKAIFILKGNIWHHLLASLKRIVLGVGGALVIGVPSGLIIGRVKFLDRLLAPLIYLAYPVPKIAFLPLVLLFLGLGDLSKVFLIALIVFFQILVHTRDAARAIDRELILSIKSLGASDMQLFWQVVFPASLTRVFTAIRISTGTAIAVLFFTETFATFRGMGFFIMDAWTRVNYVEMFAGILSLSILGLFLFLVVDLVERLFCPWLFLEDSEYSQ